MAERMDFIRMVLQSRFAVSATRMEQEKDECHELTRNRWLADLDAWITGQPGVGKSAIALTVVECLEGGRAISPGTSESSADDQSTSKAVLCGQFFVNHTLPETADPDRIFPTIAWQLAHSYPAAAISIYETLKRDKTVADRLSEKQAEALFLKPISVIALYHPGTIVSLFDGIDEMANTSSEVLERFTTVMMKILPRFPSNAKVLAFSRPETSIINQLAKVVHGRLRRSDLLTKDSEEDVRQFMTAELQKLVERCELPGWPKPDQVDLLCDYAAGHLGWASLAVRWIGREAELKGDTPYFSCSLFICS
jgi:hypothetical protein